MDKIKDLTKIINELHEIGIDVEQCYYCGESNPLLLEDHHIEGRANSSLTVKACKNCHFLITQKQNGLAPKIRSKKAIPKNRRGYQLFSLSLHMEYSAKRMQEIIEEMMDDGD